MYQLTIAAKTDVGRKRQNNEDSIAFFEPTNLDDLRNSGCLYLVADGVGGAEKGEKASQYAVQNVLYEYYRQTELPVAERLRQAIRLTNQQIYTFALQNIDGRMATTMVAAVIHNNLLTVANVGDSRAYLIRNRIARQITDDHSMVGEMMREGIMTEEEAQQSNLRNRLFRSLGGDGDVEVDIFADIPLQQGDRILLCTDGLTSYALTHDIEQIALNDMIDEVADRLIAFANDAGGSDNISVIAVQVGEEVTLTGEDSASVNFTPPSFEDSPMLKSNSLLEIKSGRRKKLLFWIAILFGIIILMGVGICTTIFVLINSGLQ